MAIPFGGGGLTRPTDGGNGLIARGIAVGHDPAHPPARLGTVMDAVPVSVSGFTWTAAGAWGAFLTLLAVVVKQWVPIKKLTISADEKLRTDLLARVDKLEKKLDEERVQHDALMALMRHRLNNSDQCIDALLMLLKSSPDKVVEAVTMIEEMRTRQRAEEAIEKASIHAANIAAARQEPVA